VTSAQRPDQPVVADLSIRLFGRVRIRWRGRELDLPSRPAQALLALLALHEGPSVRETLAADLWPDSDGRSAVHLRQSLWLLRRALAAGGADPSAVLLADAWSIELARDLVEVDALRFRSAMRRHPPDVEAALRLYIGDLAATLHAEPLARWRELLADLYEDGLAWSAAARLEAGDVAGSMRAASELLVRDPLREEAHATLIELYGMHGSRSQVHRQYARLCEILDRDLGAAPLPDTDAIYWQALARTRQRALACRGGGGRRSSHLPIAL
jgi:DNA-binding SARP family transcriptional activator